MKTYNEIKDIILNKYKIFDLQSYGEYRKIKGDKNYFISQEEIDELSPDNINNKDFWKIAEELFGVDPVCNMDSGIQTIDEGNIENLKLARHSGVLNFLDDYPRNNFTVLEIGAGYGSLKNYIKAKNKCSYMGVDVYPKILNIIETTPEGILPDEIKNKKFLHIVSTNVFQHLSLNQRRIYYTDIANILLPDGSFYFNINCVSKRNYRGYKDINNNFYMVHYGQYTPIQQFDEIVQDLEKHFKIISTSRLFYDGSFAGFQCLLK